MLFNLALKQIARKILTDMRGALFLKSRQAVVYADDISVSKKL